MNETICLVFFEEWRRVACTGENAERRVEMALSAACLTSLKKMVSCDNFPQSAESQLNTVLGIKSTSFTGLVPTYKIAF